MKHKKTRRNRPSFDAKVWEITPSGFNCIRCGRKVHKELRIYEPGLMLGQANAVSAAMRENNAGWIPLCLACLRRHPFLRPAWLVEDNAPRRGIRKA